MICCTVFVPSRLGVYPSIRAWEAPGFNQPKSQATRRGFSLEKRKKRIQSWDMLRQTHQKPDISSFILVFKPQKSPHFSPAVEAETGPLLPCGMNICQVQTTTSSLRHVFKAVFFVGVIDLQLVGPVKKSQVFSTLGPEMLAFQIPGV